MERIGKQLHVEPTRISFIAALAPSSTQHRK